ncbi:unnamed protein product [Prunus armeniaca]
MAEEMVVCNGVRRLGLVVGCDGSVSEMGSGLQRWVVRWLCFKGDGVCDGACCKSNGVCDGVCLQE